MITRIRQSGTILKNAYLLVAKSNPLLLSAATAFFTTFAMAPVLIILSHLLSLFFDEKIILPKLFTKLALSLGEKPAHDVKRIVDSFLSLETSTLATVLLTLFFYFVATTWLSSIRQSIHLLWDIRKNETKKTDYHLKERAVEVGMILLIGVLFLFTLGIDRGINAVRNTIDADHHTIYHILFFIIDAFFSILLISTWLSLLFRFMAEAKVHWRVALAGGSFTGFLFVLGRILLTKLFASGTIIKLFGPSSSIAEVLLFIFYCSFILYFGASFTYEYAKAIHEPIRPGKLADKYKEEVVEKGAAKKSRKPS